MEEERTEDSYETDTNWKEKERGMSRNVDTENKKIYEWKE